MKEMSEENIELLKGVVLNNDLIKNSHLEIDRLEVICEKLVDKVDKLQLDVDHLLNELEKSKWS